LTPQEIKDSCVVKAKDFPNGIPECGTDALRFALLSYMLQSSINLDVKRVVGYKEFCNKLWNINKFALGNFPEGFTPHPEGLIGVEADLSLADKWILTRLNKVVLSTNQCFESYNFGQMTQGLFDFWQKELAAVYLESIKPVMRKDSV
jgi:valyl-tRNA synthetase